jgi:hypothetical protein
MGERFDAPALLRVRGASLGDDPPLADGETVRRVGAFTAE